RPLLLRVHDVVAVAGALLVVRRALDAALEAQRHRGPAEADPLLALDLVGDEVPRDERDRVADATQDRHARVTVVGAERAQEVRPREVGRAGTLAAVDAVEAPAVAERPQRDLGARAERPRDLLDGRRARVV